MAPTSKHWVPQLTLAAAEGATGVWYNIEPTSGKQEWQGGGEGGGGVASTKAPWCLERSLSPEPCAWSAPVTSHFPPP